jgi:NAD(P)-dependent dehydrogenase (short-subunit alcohol dehydrogenase family)
MKVDLRKRRALVTGGTTGIGRAIAEELARHGARVMVCSRTRRELPKALDWVRADVTHERDVEALGRAARSRLGGLDILVNNVGGLEEFDRFASLTLGQWRAMFEVNLFSAVAVTQELLPLLLRSKAGRIVQIASYTATEPPSRAPHYNAAKAALVNWTKSLSRDLAPKVTVNAVSPGQVMTESWEEEAKMIAKREGRPWRSILKDIMKDASRRIPAGRMGRPSDIAACVALLASDEGAWTTGACWVVDGGATRAL